MDHAAERPALHAVLVGLNREKIVSNEELSRWVRLPLVGRDRSERHGAEPWRSNAWEYRTETAVARLAHVTGFSPPKKVDAP